MSFFYQPLYARSKEVEFNLQNCRLLTKSGFKFKFLAQSRNENVSQERKLTCTIQPPLYHRNYSVLLVLEKRDKEILQLMRIPHVKF
jgi:hypothetical protein